MFAVRGMQYVGWSKCQDRGTRRAGVGKFQSDPSSCYVADGSGIQRREEVGQGRPAHGWAGVGSTFHSPILSVSIPSQP